MRRTSRDSFGPIAIGSSAPESRSAYDQFIIEQIAGDMLPGATQDQVVATGFLCNSMLNEEGGVDPEQFRMEAMFDRMDAIGKNILGLTIQCTQCHNHKYDPLAQEEYYRIFAFLNDTDERIAAVYTADEQVQQRADCGSNCRDRARAASRSPDWPAQLAAWETSTHVDPSIWTVVRPEARRERRSETLSTGRRLGAGPGLCPHETHDRFHRPDRLDRHHGGATRIAQ